MQFSSEDPDNRVATFLIVNWGAPLIWPILELDILLQKFQVIGESIDESMNEWINEGYGMARRPADMLVFSAGREKKEEKKR